MADTINIKAEVGPLVSGLRDAGRKVYDMRPIFEAVGPRVRETVKDHIRNGVTPDGHRMEPVKYARARAQDYAGRFTGRAGGRRARRSGTRAVEKREASFFGGNRAAFGRPLYNTGRLLRSITYRAETRRLVIGTDVIYAAVHEFGHRFPARTILPRRRKALWWPGAAHPMAKVEHPGSNVPARPYMGLGVAEQKRLYDQVGGLIAQRVKVAVEGGGGAA